MMAKKKPAPAGYDEKVAEALWQQCVVKVQDEIKSQGIKQEKIAEDTGISQPAISRFMSKGDIRLERLLILMDYLGFEWAMSPKK